MEYLGRWA
jgi:hypothetical protein